MPDKTKTVVLIESHEQTIIRRSRRTVSGEVLMDRAGAQPDAPAPAVLEKPKGRWWLAVAQKGVSVFSHWSHRLQRGGNERRNKQP